jgi:hypothetical protein
LRMVLTSNSFFLNHSLFVFSFKKNFKQFFLVYVANI